jgi:DNA-binding XRE family transcriptional regulator
MKVVNNLPKLIKEKQDAYRNEHNAELPEFHLAASIGINPVTLSHYKNGKVESVNWEVWQKLAAYFGVTGDKIFNVVPDDDEA